MPLHKDWDDIEETHHIGEVPDLPQAELVEETKRVKKLQPTNKITGNTITGGAPVITFTSPMINTVSQASTEVTLLKVELEKLRKITENLRDQINAMRADVTTLKATKADKQ